MLAIAAAWGATALSAGGSAAGDGAQHGSGVVVGHIAESPAEVRAYWTAERMREAIPVGLERPGAAAAGDRQPQRGSGVDRDRVRHVREFPPRVHGKVFFREGALNFVCSGTVVQAPNRSLVVTAGHCVYEGGPAGGGFVDKFVFVPAYRGEPPRHRFGRWVAKDLATTRDWKEDGTEFGGGLGIGGDTSQDVGMAVLRRHDGKRIQNVVGARGIAFNRDRDRIYHSYGYPAQSPPDAFNGKRLFRCDSPYLGADRNGSIGSPNPMRIACDMTGGSSGGGWVSNGNVLSVNSYKYNGAENRMYGPYFGDAIRRLYRRVND